jgi:hypothetical protein
MNLRANHSFLLVSCFILVSILSFSCRHNQNEFIYGNWIIDSVDRKSSDVTNSETLNNLRQNLIGNVMIFYKDNTYKSTTSGNSPKEDFSITEKDSKTYLTFLNKSSGIPTVWKILLLNQKELLIKSNDIVNEDIFIHFSRKK